MFIIAIIYLVAVILGLIGLGWIVLHIILATRAQRALLNTIRNHDSFDTLKQLAPEIACADASQISIDKARDIIQDESNALRPALREQILEGLNQPSSRGQKAFIVKIVSDVVKAC